METSWWPVVVALALVALGWLWSRRKSPRPVERPWVASQKRGEHSYYFAHQTRPNDGLKAEDYRMNGPRRLDSLTKRPIDDADDDNENTTTKVAPPVRSTKPPVERLAKYSWRDSDTHVFIYVEPPGWDWSTIRDVELVKTSDRGFKLAIAHPESGKTYALVITNLKAPVGEVTKKQTKKRLTVTLAKRDTTLAWHKAWDSLVAGGADAEEAD